MERMSAEYSFAWGWWLLPLTADQVDQWLTLCVEYAVNILLSWNHNFGDILRQLDAWCAFNFDQFVDTAKSGLCLASHQMSADTEGIDGMSLVVQRKQNTFIDIIRSNHN